MSDYEELQQFVKALSDDAQQNSYVLANCADNVERLVASFDRLTEATRDPSAKTVGVSFRTAQKQLLIAARALIEAAKAGYTWSGDSQAELKLVLRRRR